MPMKYLVTGGAGFLGSHLIEALEGEVTVVDDMSTAKYYYFPPKVKLVKGRIEEVDVQGRFDYVIHLAARPSPEDYMDIVETALSNSLGTYKALEIARRNDATFLYTSSSEVYGHAEVIPTPEEYWGR